MACKVVPIAVAIPPPVVIIIIIIIDTLTFPRQVDCCLCLCLCCLSSKERCYTGQEYSVASRPHCLDQVDHVDHVEDTNAEESIDHSHKASEIDAHTENESMKQRCSSTLSCCVRQRENTQARQNVVVCGQPKSTDVITIRSASQVLCFNIQQSTFNVQRSTFNIRP